MQRSRCFKSGLHLRESCSSAQTLTRMCVLIIKRCLQPGGCVYLPSEERWRLMSVCMWKRIPLNKDCRTAGGTGALSLVLETGLHFQILLFYIWWYVCFLICSCFNFDFKNSTLASLHEDKPFSTFPHHASGTNSGWLHQHIQIQFPMKIMLWNLQRIIPLFPGGLLLWNIQKGWVSLLVAENVPNWDWLVIENCISVRERLGPARHCGCFMGFQLRLKLHPACSYTDNTC